MQLRSSLTSNGRNIYAGSVAKAIMGIIECEVDVISMSWTIKHELSTPNAKTTKNAARETADGRAIRALQKAIEKAKAKGIRMFCSASDNIQSGGKDTLPFNCAGLLIPHRRGPLSRRARSRDRGHRPDQLLLSGQPGRRRMEPTRGQDRRVPQQVIGRDCPGRGPRIAHHLPHCRGAKLLRKRLKAERAVREIW